MAILGIIFVVVLYLSFGAQIVEVEHEAGYVVPKISKYTRIKPRILYMMLCILWMPVVIVLLMYSMIKGAFNCTLESFVSLWKIINEKDDD